MSADNRDDEIVWRLLDLHRRMQHDFEQVAAEFELTAAEAGALRQLDKPYPMRAVADALGCDASYVTILTDRLDSLGLVDRMPDANDRRVRQLVLTPKGDEVRNLLTKRVLATSPALVGLTDERKALLLDILRSVSDQVPAS